MPNVNLSRMGVEALMDLRKRVDKTLHKRRAEIEKQLERMGRAIAVVGGARVVGSGGSALKGRKVPPKYRGPSSETWAGRGAKPKWLVAAIKGGKKLDDFLIDKSARKATEKAQVEALSFGNSLGWTMTKASFTVVILLALTMPASAQSSGPDTPSAASSWSGTRQVLYSITKHAMRRSADEIGATSISFRPKVFSDATSVVDGIFSAHSLHDKKAT
jgi:DNA-binding protein H-NS